MITYFVIPLNSREGVFCYTNSTDPCGVRRLMHNVTVKMADGTVLCGPMWTWRPKEGWFSLAGDDADKKILLKDVTVAYGKERTHAQAPDGECCSICGDEFEDCAGLEVVDYLFKARKDGWGDPPHPMQPLRIENGTVRFKRNKIVEFLLDNGGFDMNALAALNFTREDRAQFAQLIGYSVGGYCDLSYPSKESKDVAWVAMEELAEKGES